MFLHIPKLSQHNILYKSYEIKMQGKIEKPFWQINPKLRTDTW